jgi:hypothetical protein
MDAMAKDDAQDTAASDAGKPPTQTDPVNVPPADSAGTEKVHHLAAEPIVTESPMLGAPVMELKLSFTDMARVRAFFRDGIALFQELERKAENQLRQLTPEECRCADLMDRKWPPEGKPPPELLGSTSAIKKIETEMIEWCGQQNPKEIPPKRDIISRTLRKRGYLR